MVWMPFLTVFSPHRFLVDRVSYPEIVTNESSAPGLLGRVVHVHRFVKSTYTKE